MKILKSVSRIILFFIIFTYPIYSETVINNKAYNLIDDFIKEQSWGDTFENIEKNSKVWDKYIEKISTLEFSTGNWVEFQAWKSKFNELLGKYYQKSIESVTYRNRLKESKILKESIELWIILYNFFNENIKSSNAYIWFLKMKNYFRKLEFYRLNPDSSKWKATNNVIEIMLKLKPRSDRMFKNIWLEEFNNLCKNYRNSGNKSILREIKFYLRISPEYSLYKIYHLFDNLQYDEKTAKFIFKDERQLFFKILYNNREIK